MSINRLGREANIDPSQISRIERGLMGVGDEAMIRLAVALDCLVEDLFPFPDLRTNKGRTEFAAQIGWSGSLADLLSSLGLPAPTTLVSKSERRTA